MSVPQLKLKSEIEKLGGKAIWQGIGKPIRIELGGRTAEIAPSEYEGRWEPEENTWRAYVAPETLARVSGLQPVRTAFAGTPYQLEWNDKMKQVVVRDPNTGREAAITPAATWGDKAWAQPTQVETAMQAVRLPSERTAEELRGEWLDFANVVRQQTDRYFAEMRSYAEQMSDAALTMYKMYEDRLAQAFALLQQQMQQQPEVPQSVKLAINELQQAVTENAKALAEEMNRRGILQSGIAAEEERQLREKGVTEEQKLLAQWLDQEHERITRATFELANLYAQTAAPSAQMWYQAASVGPQMGMKMAEQAYQTERELAGKQFDFLSQLRQWEAEQRQAAESAYAGQLQEAQQQAWEREKFAQQLEYDYARLLETARHQQAMESLQTEANRQRADYYGWLREKGVSDQEVQKNTSDAVASILAIPTQEEAVEFLKDQALHWVTDKPVNITQVLAAMKYKFPTVTFSFPIDLSTFQP